MGIKSNLDSNFDYELVDEFLDHYSLMVDSMEVMILDLSKPAMFKRSVDELFRVFHNIKSASGYLQITPMTKLAAFVEDVLEELRKDEELKNKDIINWLLEVSDTFASWNDDFKVDNELTHIKYSLLKVPDIE